ncbi:MAG TPA: hypothetical protein VI172_19950 [Candidatus Dormibacteraeota bacterium]|jgi:hypothetical protein
MSIDELFLGASTVEDWPDGVLLGGEGDVYSAATGDELPAWGDDEDEREPDR